MAQRDRTLVNEGVERQIAVISGYAAKLSSRDIEELESNLDELDQAISELHTMVGTLPHEHVEGEAVGTPAASPATTRGGREARGSEVANPSQRPENVRGSDS